MSRPALTAFISVLLLSPLGCDNGQFLERFPQARDTAGQPGGGTLVAITKPQDSIRVASFNIQVLGTSKAQDPDVMNVLANVVRRFDVVAIQELRTTDAAVMDYFIRLINQGGEEYQYVVGPRLGRTTSKEQYVFVFDSRRIELIPQTVVTLEDPHDLLHREPLIGLFRTRTQGPAPPFSFILVNIHTDPDETKQELDALAEVFVAVQQNPWREDDVILLGDLNVDYRKLGQLGQLPDITCTVRGEPTNTRGSASYDNIVFNQVATTEFTNRSGVLDLKQEFQLTVEQALRVSDHMPVWAEFHVVEGGAPALFAGRPGVPGTLSEQAPATSVPVSTPSPYVTPPPAAFFDRVPRQAPGQRR